MDKENVQLLIEGFDIQANEHVFAWKPYMHRWKSEYMRARLAKFYLLDVWVKEHPAPLSMLTFTTFHDSAYAAKKRGKGVSIEESWEILKSGFRKASLLIRNKIRKGVPYFWIIEPQPESGYPHLHAGYFTEFNDFEQTRLRNHWANVVKAGDYKHGLDFSFDQHYKENSIASLRNYLMKYLAKTLYSSISSWSPEELVFNALGWKNGHRYFGCSQGLSKAMQRLKEDRSGYTWLTTILHRSDRGFEEDRIIRQNQIT
jgi:hypothetical protein